MLPDWFFLAALFLFGLLFGSFANVVIWRFPKGMSVSRPASHCPKCGTPILWYDNVPIVSWVLLRARCRTCATPISARYPTVELLSGLLWTSAGIRFGQEPLAGVAVVFLWTLLVLAFIDLDTMRLPNTIVGVLALVGIVAAAVSEVASIRLVPLVGPSGTGGAGSPLVWSLTGALLAGGLSLAMALAYRFIRGRSGFGMGDVKLLGAMGLFLGAYSLVALLIGSLVGAIAGIAVALRSRSKMATTKIPFGPFLALGGVVAVLVGEQIVAAYLHLIGLS